MFARLKPGYTVESARASLQPLFHQILEQEAREPRVSKMSPYYRRRLSEAHGDRRDGGERLLGYAATILDGADRTDGDGRTDSTDRLVRTWPALLVARAVARQKEIAVRLAMGAARRTLIGQLLVESTLLSLAGAATGLVLSLAATRALLSMLPITALSDAARGTGSANPTVQCRVGAGDGNSIRLDSGGAGTKLDIFTTLKDVVGAVPEAAIRRD